MKHTTVTDVSDCIFNFEQYAFEQRHRLLIENRLEAAVLGGECEPSACSPTVCNSSVCDSSPESPQESSVRGEDNVVFKSLIRPETSYVGLVNQAMTCYLNSLLQALYMTPEFRNALYNWEYVNGSEKDEANSIPYQLQKLFLNLQTSTESAVETTALTKSFGWDSTEAWQQHDIQELCRVMFDALEQKFKKTEQADLINRLYEGMMTDYVKCLKCGTEKSREDTFLDIPLPVRPFGSNVAYNSVEEALAAFVQYETLEGNNQYQCEKCNKKCDAHKGLKFTRFPYLLTLHLKRFDFDFKTFHRIKLNDKVTFPDTLNLNTFISTTSNEESPGGDEEDIGLVKCDDSSTTDSGTLDDEYPLCENSLPNSNHSTNHDDDNDDDKGIDVSNGPSTSNCTAHNYENEKNRSSNAAKGPYNYELFSIMIHSGSASGGHYYAYIKDFRTGKWLCFNDQSVTEITHDDIQQMYGGGPTRLYYNGAYSSTNAYMLMYRQIDPTRNALPMQVQDFPKHIQELLKKMKENEWEGEASNDDSDRGVQKLYDKGGRRKVYRCTESHQRPPIKMRSRDDNFATLKIKVFCQPPMEKEKLTSQLYIIGYLTWAEVTKKCYHKFCLEGTVDLDQCRLVNYDHKTDTILRSYEGREHEPLRTIWNYDMNSLLLQICEKNQKFESYSQGIITKVYVVDVPRRLVTERAIDVQALSTQTVKEYKQIVGKIVNMDPDEMKIVLRKHYRESILVEDDNQLLEVDFSDSDLVYVSTMLDTECKPFFDSALNEIIENFEDIKTVTFELPDTSPEVLEQKNIPSLDEKYKDKEKPVANSPSVASANESQCDTAAKSNDAPKSGKCYEDAPMRNMSPQLGKGEEWNTPEQSNSEDSSLSDSDKTLVGDTRKECVFDVPYLLLRTTNHSIAMLDQIKLENWDNEADDSKYYFKATPFINTCVQVQVDQRMKLATLKRNLEPYVGVPSEFFKIYPRIKHGKTTEWSCLTSTLGSHMNVQNFRIRLGRTLSSDEYATRLYQFQMGAHEPYYYFFNWFISKNKTVGETKKEILAELKKKYNLDIPYDRCRLREKCQMIPSKVFLDDQKFEVYENYSQTEMIIQELPDKEPVTNDNQVVVFIRRWYPAQIQLGPFQEIVVDRESITEIRKKLSEISEIPEEYIDIARMKDDLSYELPTLQIQNEQGWNKNLLTTEYLVNDGSLFLYRDTRETLKHLSRYEFNEMAVQELSRVLSPPSTPRRTRKEKALRIQLTTE